MALFWGLSKGDQPSTVLAQVYKAVLRDTGEEVAIKVQRPGVEPVILRDLFIFRSMARFINPICKVESALSSICWQKSHFFASTLGAGTVSASSLYLPHLLQGECITHIDLLSYQGTYCSYGC